MVYGPLLFALLLPRGIWGEIERRLGVQMLPVGYRLDPGTGRGKIGRHSK
jgi:branched-chain amino acid transport system permease protein